MYNTKCFIVVMSVLTLLISCGNQKTVTEYKEIVKIDTIYKNKVVELTKSVHDTLLIESPCDSVGNLKPFKSVLKTNNANISLSNENGRISLKIDLDSIYSVWESTRKVKTLEKVVNKTIVKRIPRKLNYYSIILNVLFIGWIFRKKIPYLKFIF